ncbi:hypothetical protein JAAARDRAFT_157094 [Jaapia argillacea MUCL 33604]|uniref:Protein kinase domain-containing protein n=1 Tax=Jaapia argillacea MUCL 33604 TaxID=933084 RepID=A0A067PT63_9AGAM|nr:hypothetical protein JAAARDRAFT_157094 [Jaapia argillacea MUCL 33604]
MPEKKVTLWYRYFDSPSDDDEKLKVDAHTDVSDLKRELQAAELPHPLKPNASLKRRDLIVWQVNSRVKIPVGDHQKWRKTLNDYGNDLKKFATRLPASHLVSTLEPRAEKETDLISLILSAVRSHEWLGNESEEDVVGSLDLCYNRRYDLLWQHQDANSGKSTSQAATSSSYRESEKQAFPIYDGRRPINSDASSTIAMPPSLYHPIFQRWRTWAFDLELTPPPEVVAASAKLMRLASVLNAPEDQYKQALRPALQDALSQAISTVIDTDLTMMDGRTSIQVTLNGSTRNVPVLVDQENLKQEATDAATQASFSMLRMWSLDDFQEFRNRTCCPTFLIGLDGCHLVVCGAVITDKCIVDRLAMMWVGRSTTHDEDRTEDVARLFYALALAIKELKNWYQTIGDRPAWSSGMLSHPRFFPFADCYPLNGEDFDAGIVRFQYKYPLQTSSTCVSFLAHAEPGTEGSKPIVIKFVQRYCPELHRLLAAQDAAPKLLYHGRIDKSTPYRNWTMVVMAYFDGKPSYEDDLYKTGDVCRKVASIVTSAHLAGFVLGDVRPPNVLVSATGVVKLIDFDWAGREGDEVRYPAHISDAPGFWVDGVEAKALIKRSHDQAMVAKYFSAV